MADIDLSMEYPGARFTYEHFQLIEVAELIIRIWHYSSEHGKNCNLCKIYKKTSVKVLRETWKDEYIDENFVIDKICKQDKNWCNLDELTSTEQIYKLIKKKSRPARLKICLLSCFKQNGFCSIVNIKKH